MKRLFTLAIFTICIAGGCVSARAPRYYYLTAPPVSPQAGTQQFPVTILVGRLSAPRILRDDRVVYGMTDVELGVDEYHRWSEPPTEMIEQLLVERLRRSGQYKSVQKISSTARGDYLLRGHLSSLNEIDEPGGIKARFNVQLELFDQKAGAVVWTESYSHDEPVEKKSVSTVVEALQKNVNAGIEQVSASLAQYFVSHSAR
ncbi:MAG TPA: ABC-type transport auxiliary lipoprotein family protein [Verrucomicrobiae bacterium]|nr:ABC-type transport auxiliary lipoprotein family protein [Verrucomicrobiae bacterium]